MQTLIVPFGNAGWKEKKKILDGVIASRSQPPFLYNDVLILVPSARLKRSYGRMILNAAHRIHGIAAVGQPDIQTFHQLQQQLHSRLDGPRLIDETSRLVLIEGLAKECLLAGDHYAPQMEVLAPSLSSFLARMIEQLSGAGVGPKELLRILREADLHDKPQARLLTDVYSRYEARLDGAGLVDPAGMRARLLERFDAGWLANFRKIIVDGIIPDHPSEEGILRAVLACGDCTFLLNAPGSEHLFDRAQAHHPLAIVTGLLRALDVKLHPAAASLSDGDRYLASALFSESTFSETAAGAPDPARFGKNIRVLSALNMREEISLIAREVKISLRRGSPPESILVTFPALDEYAPLVEEIFRDHGIPYNRALGRQLSTSPVAAGVVSMLHALLEDFSGPSLVRVFSSPFLACGSEPSIAYALEKMLRERKIAGGRHKVLWAAKVHDRELAGPAPLSARLQDLFSALEPFSDKDPEPLAAWMERLADLIAWASVGERVARIKGPLNINVQAYAKMTETCASLARAGLLFPSYRYTFSEWFFLLRKTFMHARFQVPPEDEGGVQILGIEESVGHPWNEICVGGLTDRSFPQRQPQNIFLPERTLELLGVRTLERARLNAAYHFYRLLLSADSVLLTHPENDGDKPIVPSPFLAELQPLNAACLVNLGVERTSGIQSDLSFHECGSISDLAKAAAMSPDGNCMHARLFDELSEILPGMAEQLLSLRNAVSAEMNAVAPAVADRTRRVFRVTELDEYISCPYDYYITRVLGIRPLEAVTDDISPSALGSKVHIILLGFYRTWKGPVTLEARQEALRLLQDIAVPLFDAEPDTFRNRREKDRFVNRIAVRFVDAEIEFWKQGMKPLYLEHMIEHYPLVLTTGETVELSAKIDRIDGDERGGFIILDYKTGKYPRPKKGVEQDIFQLPVYAVMAREVLSGGGRPPLRRPIGLGYYDLSGKFSERARDVVLFDESVRRDHPTSKPETSPRDAGTFEAILQHSMDKARRAVEAILEGRFPGEPQDENKCRTCVNKVMCGREGE